MSKIFNPSICGCTHSYVQPPCPPTSSGNCIRLCNFYVNSNESIWPCNELGQVQFEDKLQIPEDCTAQYNILSYSDNLKNVSIDNAGVTFTSNWSEGKDYLKGEIVYEVKCGSLSNEAIIYVFFKKGDTLNCEGNLVYDPCTGNCTGDPEISISSNGQGSGEISINSNNKIGIQ